MKKLFCLLSLMAMGALLPLSLYAQKALAVSWTGYAESNTAFSSFLKGNHTVAFRFMPQFPNTYYGPVLAENGTGTYFIGTGDFFEAGSSSSLRVAIGSKSITIPYTLNAGTWYQVTVTCKENGNNLEFKIYINGTDKGSLSVAKNDAQLPTGNIRFGKRTTGQTVNGNNAQFYGLIDDVAIFKSTLSSADISKLVSNKDITNLSSPAPDISYNFNTAGTHGAASVVGISAAKSGDASKLPLPTAQKTMNLPITRGEAWYVIQGCDDKGGSHKGYASFCWDLMVADKTQGNDYPDGTGGAPVHAAASGKVVTVQQGKTSGESPSNMIEIEQQPNEICAYLHIRKNSSAVAKDDHPLYGEVIAKTGDVGAAVGANHIHIAVTDKPDGTAGFVTFPVAFSDYEVRQADGSWKHVDRGMPKQGEVIRRPPVDDLPYKMVAVWRPAGNDAELQAYGYTYDQLKQKYDGIWDQGYRLASIRAHVYSGQLRYTAVWKKGMDGSEKQVYGWTYNDYRQKYDELWDQGWRLKLLDVCVLNGVPRYTAVWKKSTESEKQVYGWSYDDLRKKYDTLWNQGWRLKLISSYSTGNDVRYTAVWTPGTAGEKQVYGWAYDDFKKKYDELWQQGMRLALLSNCVVNGKTRYTAVWRANTSGEYQVYEWKYKDYREFYDNLWMDGWRLNMLNVL